MKRSNPNRHRSSHVQGFTLIELMIVVVILGMLATMVMPKVLSKPEQARRTKAKVDIRSMQSALALFKTDTGRFPSTSEGLQALVTNPGLDGYDSEGYLERVPTDPWGNAYVYLCPGIHSKGYDLESYGKDGEDGGTDDDADVESWNIES
jgi:general secretion pathway protein G